MIYPPASYRVTSSQRELGYWVVVAFAAPPASESEYPQSLTTNPIKLPAMMTKTMTAMNHCLCFLVSLFYILLNILDTPKNIENKSYFQ